MDPKDKELEKKRAQYEEMRGGHVAADEDKGRAVPADLPPDTSSPYRPDIPGYSPGRARGDDLDDMGGRSHVNASADAGSPSAPESEPSEAHEPPYMPLGRGVGEGDRGVGDRGGLTATPGPPKKRREE